MLAQSTIPADYVFGVEIRRCLRYGHVDSHITWIFRIARRSPGAISAIRVGHCAIGALHKIHNDIQLIYLGCFYLVVISAPFSGKPPANIGVSLTQFHGYLVLLAVCKALFIMVFIKEVAQGCGRYILEIGINQDWQDFTPKFINTYPTLRKLYRIYDCFFVESRIQSTLCVQSVFSSLYFFWGGGTLFEWKWYSYWNWVHGIAHDSRLSKCIT